MGKVGSLVMVSHMVQGLKNFEEDNTFNITTKSMPMV